MSQTDLRVYLSFGVAVTTVLFGLLLGRGPTFSQVFHNLLLKHSKSICMLSAIECRSGVLTWSKQHVASI